ncbi:MAG: sulfur reduction protein DsrS [Gammaproteobacteria bacterium]|jgi:hypothetical protein
MELSHEDSLRLNVLVKQDLYAVRIDEASMTVHALTAKGEARVQLNPNCRDDAYLRRIRELLSTHALGSPGGYPVYLKRWTRMGQMREQSLDSLLILGEPEAVIAVAHAAGLTEEIARRAWWVMPTAEVARKMLECANVANSELGRELAHFLIEFLPFEAESFDVVHSVRLVLQPGLIDESIRLGLWKKAARKSAYYVGFLYADPKVLPRELGEHAELPQLLQQLKPLLEKGNSVVTQLVQVLSGSGQNYLQTIENALEKIADQDVMVALLNALQRYFHPTWPDDYTVPYHRLPEEIDQVVANVIQANTLPFVQPLSPLMGDDARLKQKVEALLKLSLVGEPLVNPIFSQTDAVGSVMRKRLRPVTDWLLVNVALLKS